jgi:hypothetical protein
MIRLEGWLDIAVIHILPNGIERLHKLPHGLRVAP